MRSVLLCLSTIESEDCSLVFLVFFRWDSVVIPKRLGWCMFCLTDDHFIMRILFGTLQVYMLLVYILKETNQLIQAVTFLNPTSWRVTQQPLSPGHVNSLTHHPPKKVTNSPALPGRWDFLRMFFRDADSPKYSTQRNVKLPEFFLVRFEIIQTWVGNIGLDLPPPTPKRSRIPGWLEEWRFRYKCDVILVGGRYILELPPHPVTVTTRIIPSFSRESQPKASFVTVTGWGVDQRYIQDIS